MSIPEDPNILVSLLNMKLRDGDYEDLQDLLSSLDYDKEEVIDVLEKAGFSYNEKLKQFR